MTASTRIRYTRSNADRLALVASAKRRLELFGDINDAEDY